MDAMRTLAAVCLAAALMGAAAWAQTPAEDPAPAEGDRDCFRPNQMSGWRLIDNHTMRIRINGTRIYALTTDSSMRILRDDYSMALRGPSDWVCVGDGAGVEIHSTGDFRRTWFVDSVTRLPRDGADEAEAAQN